MEIRQSDISSLSARRKKLAPDPQYEWVFAAPGVWKRVPISKERAFHTDKFGRVHSYWRWPKQFSRRYTE